MQRQSTDTAAAAVTAFRSAACAMLTHILHLSVLLRAESVSLVLAGEAGCFKAHHRVLLLKF